MAGAFLLAVRVLAEREEAGRVFDVVEDGAGLRAVLTFDLAAGFAAVLAAGFFAVVAAGNCGTEAMNIARIADMIRTSRKPLFYP